MPEYALSGLILASDLPLAGLEERTLEGHHVEIRRAGRCTVESTWEPVLDVHAPNAPELHFMSVARQGDRYRIRMDGYVEFTLEGDHTILCSPEEGVDASDVDQLLIDIVVPMLVHRRGELCLHASAIARAGGVHAFIASSGSGKSTLAASLARRGDVMLMSDDGLALDAKALVEDGVALAHPGRMAVRLRPPSAAFLGEGFGQDIERYREARTGKTRLTTARSAKAQPLARIYVLEEEDRNPGVEVLSQAQAMAHLVHHLHRLDPGDRRLLAREVELLTALVQNVEVVALRYRRRFEDLPAVERLILGEEQVFDAETVEDEASSQTR